MSAAPPLSRRKRALFTVVALGLALMASEGVARLAFRLALPHLETTRRFLAGEIPPAPGFQRCVGQAYLLYIPAPNYSDAFGPQHNEHGYRGRAVPMRRVPGVTRVLCLGGSTTYGWLVDRPDDTYPAQLERILAGELPPGVQGVEVINAGLPWGTTAEILTHYHFKFHYYEPDVVVVNAGGNDAEGLTTPHYQPDYSHWRQPMVLPQPLAPAGRTLLRCRLAALVLVPLVEGTHPERTPFIHPEGIAPVAPWFPPVPTSPRGPVVPPLREEDIAFEHNLEALLDELQRDGARVLLVPFRAAPKNGYPPGLREAFALEERILGDLAAARKLDLAPFPADVISPGNWLDECHPNAAGSREKALYLAPYVRTLAWGSPPPAALVPSQN